MKKGGGIFQFYVIILFASFSDVVAIPRLHETSLLQEKFVDIPGDNEEKIYEWKRTLIPLKKKKKLLVSAFSLRNSIPL